MPNLSGRDPLYVTPAICDYTNIGTTAGTTTISSEPCYIERITITSPVASNSFVLFDSDGTSANVIGTITGGTATSTNPYHIDFGFRTQHGLTIAHTTANAGAIVSWGR